jgi:hypothetical protein
MTRPGVLIAVLLTYLAVPAVLADGGMFLPSGEAADLAQTRQEVLIAFHSGSGTDTQSYATYVIKTRYSGEPESLAWVIPAPSTPTGVVAHDDDAVFDRLDLLTRPHFWFPWKEWTFGCGCAAPRFEGDLAGGTQNDLVVVEARGEAGIFEWAALTSTGGSALLTWLNDNDFAVSTAAATVLDAYIQDDWHFLAVRVREPDSVTSATGDIEIPPIQFTCQTTRRVYPMAISRVSAASEVEVVIYILSDRRAAASNLANLTIDESEIIYDATSESETNYEELFRQAISAQGGQALVTEHAEALGRTGVGWPSLLEWADVPDGAGQLQYLTRLRTAIARENMTIDFEFQDAATDTAVFSSFMVASPLDTILGSLFGLVAAGLIPLGVVRGFVRWRIRRNARSRAFQRW